MLATSTASGGPAWLPSVHASWPARAARAAKSAVRLPSDPPEVSRPPAEAGSPSVRAIQPTTASSWGVAAPPISYTAMPLLSSAASASISTAPGTGGGTWWPSTRGWCRRIEVAKV